MSLDRDHMRNTNSKSFMNEKEKLSTTDQSMEDETKKGDVDKFFKDQSARLEEKLIEKEFFKHYDKKAVYTVFILVFGANVLINVDHGTLPACPK